MMVAGFACAPAGKGFEPWTDPALGRAIAAPADADEGPDAGGAAARAWTEAVLSPDADAEAYAGLALERHPAIEAATQRIVSAEARVKQARSLSDPQLMVSPVGEMSPTLDGMPMLMAGVTQAFPFPGKLTAMGRSAEAEVEVARSQLRAVRLRVAREAREAYWRYYNAARSLEVTRAGVDLLRQAHDAADAAYRTGGGAQENVLAASMEASVWENEVLTLEDRLGAAAGALNATIDRPLGAELPMPAAREPAETRAELASLLARAARHNPELVTLRRRIDAGHRSLREAKLSRWPDFSVGVQYNVVDPEEAMGAMPATSGDDEWWVTFGITLPIWKGKYDAREKEARSELLARLADLRSESNRVAAEVQAAVAEAQTQDRMVRLFGETLLPQARQAREAALSGYRGGRGAFAAVIDATRRVLEYEQMFHQAHAELGRKLAALAELAGDEPRSAAEVRHE